MLRLRVITALLLAAGVLIALMLLPKLWFLFLVLLITGLALHEWRKMFTFHQSLLHICSPIFYFAFCAFLLLVPKFHSEFLTLFVLLWGILIVSVILYPRGQEIYNKRSLLAFMGLLLLSGGWLGFASIISIEGDIGKIWIVWMLLLTTCIDVGAFFGGRLLGKRKLAPQVSPAKTVEGSVSGAILGMLICAPLVITFLNMPLFGGILLTLGLSVIAIYGDLFESLIKRLSGVKDSGSILPGHGGVLDRVDSILAVAPFLAWSLR